MIDFGWLGHIAFTWQFLVAVMSIILIDLVLAGDNAVVIAMAVRNLPGRQRMWGIALGAGAAVVVRVAATFLVAQLLNIQFIKLVGGAVIIWIAVKLLSEGTEEECTDKECGNIWEAVWIIIVADMSMGIDNMLAVGAASHGNLFLLLFGLRALDPVRGVHEQHPLQADEQIPDHSLARRGDPGQGGWRDDDHGSVGPRPAEPAQVGGVRGDGVLCRLRLPAQQMDCEAAQVGNVQCKHCPGRGVTTA